MNRSAFLRSLVVGAGALVVGDEALDAFARLNHKRKSFASAWPVMGGGVRFRDQHGRRFGYEIWEKLPNGMWHGRTEMEHATVYEPDLPECPLLVLKDKIEWTDGLGRVERRFQMADRTVWSSTYQYSMVASI